MTTVAKPVLDRRLARFQRTGYYCIIALDHGMSFGTMPGIGSISELQTTIDKASAAGAAAIVLNFGALRHVSVPTDIALIAQLVGMPMSSAGGSSRRVPLAKPIDALVHGADGVSIQVSKRDLRPKNAAMLSKLINKAHKIHLPVMLMLTGGDWANLVEFRTAVRSLTELGCDLIKASPGAKLLREGQGTLSEYSAPLLYPGGDASDRFWPELKSAHAAGYSGICVGRNLFQADSISTHLARIDSVFSQEA